LRTRFGIRYTESLVVVPENCDVYYTISMLRKGGVRRMPVVNAEGALTGIVSPDDLLPVVAQELADLARLPSAEEIASSPIATESPSLETLDA
jgi:CBS domain-containing protein